MAHCPLYRSAENGFIVVIHSEYKAAIDHDAKIVQPSHDLVVIAVQVLYLPLAMQIAEACGLEADKEAAQFRRADPDGRQRAALRARRER